ncbi:MAG: lytic transglycosylase domain-containing protein [Deltaproteobacteria bacterium]|nr:lytic transglycosylase domain-containing protein [Deltaproteobacteria bacterium]
MVMLWMAGAASALIAATAIAPARSLPSADSVEPQTRPASAPATAPAAPVEAQHAVRAALHGGDAQRALALAAQDLRLTDLSAPLDAEALVRRSPLLSALFATAAQRLGREDLALPLYQTLHAHAAAAGDAVVAARLAIRIGDVLAEADHGPQAESWYLRAADADVLQRAALGRARALRRARQWAAALAALEQTEPLALDAEHPLRPALLAEAARSAAELGDQARQLRYLTVLWTQHPETNLRYPGALPTTRDGDPYAGVALAVLQKQVGPGGVVARAEALLARNLNRAALETLAGFQAPDAALQCRAGWVRGKASRNLRRYAAATRALEPVAKACPEQAPKALYLLGLMATFKREPERALEIFDRFAASFPRHDLADDVLFLAGDQLTQQGRHAEAERYYQRVADDHVEGDYHDQAMWRLAWGAHLAGDDRTAGERLDAIARATATRRDAFAFQRAVYWRSRLSGAREKTIDNLDGLVRADPVSYYGLLARQRLYQLAPARGQATDSWLIERAQAFRAIAARAHALPLPDLPAARLGRALLEAGLDDEAREVLGTIDFYDLPLNALVPLARDLQLAGAEHAAHWMVRKRAEEELIGLPDPADALLWRAGFPQGYAEIVDAWARKRRLDQQLVFALIREESAFEASVVSWAGAIGLMQLMPYTARDEARLDKVGAYDVAQLIDPDLNVRLGSAHIARRLRTFKGNAALAIAAYNAGPEAVKAWLPLAPSADLDVLLEAIPIEQTRDYTKRVLRSWVVYRYLYRPDAPFVDLAIGIE